MIATCRAENPINPSTVCSAFPKDAVSVVCNLIRSYYIPVSQ